MSGLELKELRKELGLKQEDMSRVIGISTRTLARWETVDTIKAHVYNQKRILKLKVLEQLLLEEFELDEIEEWLTMPNEALDGHSPIKEMLYNDMDGLDSVINLLESIKHGVYA